MRVTVTGASGFIGQAVVTELRRRGADVVAVSRGASRCPADVTAFRVADYGDTPAGDILIHLAEPRDVSTVSADMAESAMRTASALARRFHRMVYASSAAVYGDEIGHPRRPDEAIRPASPYARMKHEGERSALDRGGVAVRIANVYGPGMAPTSVVSEIVAQVGGVGPLRVRDGEPVRDFLWSEDSARGLVSLATTAVSGVFNLGTGTGVSIAELARHALSIVGEQGRTVTAVAPAGRKSVLVLDPSATTEACGWVPRTGLADGLRMLLGRKP